MLHVCCTYVARVLHACCTRVARVLHLHYMSLAGPGQVWPCRASPRPISQAGPWPWGMLVHVGLG